MEKPVMETTKQLSVFLENKPGRMANLLSILAQERVNLLAMTVMDSHEHSVLRFVAEDLVRARAVVKANGFPATEAEVMVVELRNQVGALAHLCEVLASEHINIDYAYCSAGGRNGRTLGIFKVSNCDRALKVLGNSANHSTRRRMGRRPMHTRNSHPSST
jgi:hypothetical protein